MKAVTSAMGQDSLNHMAPLCFERADVNRVDIKKVMSFHQKGRSNFVFPNNFWTEKR